MAEPKFNFEYSDTAGFLKLAQTYEDTGVSAYNGAGPAIKSKEVLGGGRLDRSGRGPARGGDPPPEQGRTGSQSLWTTSLDEAQVLKAVEPFIA